MREGLKRILADIPDIHVADEAIDGHDTLTKIKYGGFDQVVLDLSMPGRSGVDLIRQIRRQAPKLPILVLTMHDEEQYAIRTIRAGAQGYLTKDSACKQLVNAIRKIATGHPYISFEVAEQLISSVYSTQEDLPHKNISDREFEIFSLLVDGKTITEIADQLYLSVKTVSTHKTNLMKKMKMKTLSELIQYAVKNDLISPLD